jgi:predicted nucleic acid-binding protein
LIVIDSSGWLQYFMRGPLVASYRGYVQGDEPILVPAVVIYEVYKTLRREISEQGADEAAMQLTRYPVAPLDADCALAAAEVSLKHGLPFADAVIYATAEIHEATLITSDAHFANLPAVRFISKAEGE